MPHGRPMLQTHRLLSTYDEYIFAEHRPLVSGLVGVSPKQIPGAFGLVSGWFGKASAHSG